VVEAEQKRASRRRAAILKAATDVFLECGYEGARLEDVIRRSGGSLATLYAQFGDKAGLFGAIIASICDEIVSSLPEVGQPRSETPEKALFAFGSTYLRLLLTPLSLALYRVVIGESARFPELGRAVYEAGPATAAKRLAAYMRQQTKARALAVADPDLAARHFLEMVKGDLHFRALLGSTPSVREVDACVRLATRTFIDGNRARQVKRPRF
jgi:TetR/AcrR family transcriptional regulator, mexJK operon transcriptional repressor